jgi:hypothetical protein
MQKPFLLGASVASRTLFIIRSGFVSEIFDDAARVQTKMVMLIFRHWSRSRPARASEAPA